MVVKVYVSGISGNKEVKKRQQRVLMILDSKNIKYEIIDITEPGRENDKDFMQNNAKNNGGTVSDPNPRSPLPPQVFNDEEYCGDYDQFDLANEVDTLEQFLKIELPSEEILNSENEKTEVLNGDVKTEEKVSDKSSQEGSQEKERIAEEISKSKEGTPNKEITSVNSETALEEVSPLKDDVSAKEGSPVSEVPETKSVEREGTPSEKVDTEKEPSDTKESSPEKDESINENGTVSSREQSVDAEEKDEVEKKKESASESLIESEKLASTE